MDPRFPDSRTCKRSQGFTLVEMLIAAFVSVLLMAAIFSGFIFQRRAFEAQQQVNEMQQNVRSATDMLSRDVRMAGYGLKVPSSKLSLWVDWVPGMTENPLVVQGDSGDPDRVTIAAALDEPLTSLLYAVTNRSNIITVAPGDGEKFNTTDRKILYIGKSETVRIVAVAGDTLVISRDPTDNGKGLKHSYEAGTPVELVRAVTYRWVDATSTYPFQPHLTRESLDQDYAAEWQKITAGNIDDFQVTTDTYALDVEVVGRTAKEDSHYTDPDHGDHYRRLGLETRVYPRNIKLWR
jgi:prepilin-type N-terminal cleavage/methylation domain-containing protein